MGKMNELFLTIYYMVKEGKNVIEISEELGLSESLVANGIRRYPEFKKEIGD